MVAYSFNTWNHSSHWGMQPTLPEQVTAAAAVGYDYVGLDVPSIEAHEAEGLSARGIAGVLQRQGIRCFEIAALTVSADVDATEHSLAQVCRFARELEARYVLAVVRGDDAAVARQARRCVEALADIGVRVAVEFLPTIELNSIDAVCRLLDQVDHPALTVMIDSWHFFEGPSTWHSLESLPVDRLGFVQFSDAARALTEDVAFEYRHRRVLPGEGTHDVAGFAQAIQRRSADVTVSIEVLSAPWRRRPVERFAADALAATRRVWESS